MSSKKYICYEMIYKPNENKEEKKEKMKYYKFIDKKEYTGELLRIFGRYFVKHNKNNCRIIYKNKIYKLKEYLEEIDNNNYGDIIKLKLIIFNNIINMKEMFYGCYHLTSISE